ncbi:TPA: hypothetical protein ACIF2F_002257, partial [Acinetobacter baumannii]
FFFKFLSSTETRTLHNAAANINTICKEPINLNFMKQRWTAGSFNMLFYIFKAIKKPVITDWFFSS